MSEKALKIVNGVPRMVTLASPDDIYDETVVIPDGGLAAFSNITLPESQEYTGAELQVYLNGQRMEDLIDYTYVGSAPRTQINTNYDLYEGDRVRFIIEP
jgi:hypothetical protein